MNYKSLQISFLLALFLGLCTVGVSFADEMKNIFLDLTRVNSLALANAEGSNVRPEVELIVGDVIKLQIPIVSITFDDGYESAFKYAHPILDKDRFKATYYVMSNYLGRSGYMKVNEVLDLYNSGNEIGAHTKNHPNLTSLNENTATEEIFGSKKDLELLGLRINSFAYPYGDYNEKIEKITKSAGYSSARTIKTWYNVKDINYFALGGFSIYSDTSLEKVYNYLDTAVENNKWAILIFHRINEYDNPISISSDNFQKIIEYIKKLNVSVLTVRDALKRVQQ